MTTSKPNYNLIKKNILIEIRYSVDEWNSQPYRRAKFGMELDRFLKAFSILDICPKTNPEYYYVALYEIDNLISLEDDVTVFSIDHFYQTIELYILTLIMPVEYLNSTQLLELLKVSFE